MIQEILMLTSIRQNTRNSSAGHLWSPRPWTESACAAVGRARRNATLPLQRWCPQCLELSQPPIWRLSGLVNPKETLSWIVNTEKVNQNLWRTCKGSMWKLHEATTDYACLRGGFRASLRHMFEIWSRTGEWHSRWSTESLNWGIGSAY